jgi:hypothetical protein
MELGDDIRLATGEGKDTTNLEYEQRVWSRLRIDARVGLVQSGEELEAFQKKIDEKYNPKEDPLLNEEWQTPPAKLSTDLALKQLGISRKKQFKENSKGKSTPMKASNNLAATGRVLKNSEDSSRHSMQRTSPAAGTTQSLRSKPLSIIQDCALELGQGETTVANPVIEPVAPPTLTEPTTLGKSMSIPKNSQTSYPVLPGSSVEPVVTATTDESVEKPENAVRLRLTLSGFAPETKVERSDEEESDVREPEDGTKSHAPSGFKSKTYLPLEKWWLHGMYCLWQEQQEMGVQIPQNLRVTHGSISEAFNKTFGGKLVDGYPELRPERTAAAMQLYYAHHLKGESLKAPIPDYWAAAGMAKPANISLDISERPPIQKRKILAPKSRNGILQSSDPMKVNEPTSQRPLQRLRLNFTSARNDSKAEGPVPTTSDRSGKRKLSQIEKHSAEKEGDQDAPNLRVLKKARST